MTRRTKIVIIVFIIAIFFMALVALAPLLKKQESQNLNNENPLANTNAPRQGGGFPDNTNVDIDTRVTILTKEPASQSVLVAIAMTFAEKFGSFSSQGNFENISDAKFYMTERMKLWSDEYVKKNKNASDSPFYGITTRALKAEILTLSDDESQAQLLVTTQQEEFTGSISSRGKIMYKRLLLDFVKVESEWKVDAVEWK